MTRDAASDRSFFRNFFINRHLKLFFIETCFYIFLPPISILNLHFSSSYFFILADIFFKDFRLIFSAIFDLIDRHRECDLAREIPLARASVHSLFPSSWSRAIPPLCGISLWTRVRCLRSFSSHLSSWIPHLFLPLSFASEIAHVCVRACVRACVRLLLFFSAPVANAADVGRRGYRRSRYQTHHVWSNDRPNRWSIFPSRQQPRSSLDNAVEIDAIHLHRELIALYPQVRSKCETYSVCTKYCFDMPWYLGAF